LVTLSWRRLFTTYLATGLASLSLNARPLCNNKKKEEESKDSRRNLVLHLLYIRSLPLPLSLWLCFCVRKRNWK